MQFTGLLDKNGKEIFEGDIVKGTMKAGAGYQRKAGKECLYEIKKTCGGWGYSSWLKQITELKGDYRGYPHFDECEIIGNIYETPELLK